MNASRQWAMLPAVVKLLLVTQLLFNVGFYLVVPFLSFYMTDSLVASAAMVGLVLGLRTFSQQGDVFVGGALADWWGIRPVLLVGHLDPRSRFRTCWLFLHTGRADGGGYPHRFWCCAV